MGHRVNALENEMKSQQHEIGMVGLGVMGRNLVLNMADHGFPVAGYDKDTASQAGKPENSRRPIFATAAERPIVAIEPLSRY